MLSVKESARELGVSPARVRQLIASNAIEATKVGRSWVVSETSVQARLERRPSPGRPSRPHAGSIGCVAEQRGEALHALYLACKQDMRRCLTAGELAAAGSQEEADFYAAVSDFFLQREQRELVARGVF